MFRRNFDFYYNDDTYSDDESLYQEISNAVDDILGDKATITQKLELYDYLLYKKNQMLQEYIDSHSNPYQNPYFCLCQMPNNIPLTYMQPPQFNPYFNQIPQPNKSSKSESESDSESESKSESSEKKHHHHHKKKKSKKDKKSKDKKVKKGKKKEPVVKSITPICTCAITQHKYIRQKWYYCRTCGLTGNKGCCEYCARTCHKGHDVFFKRVGNQFYCDCLDTGKCKLLPPTDLRCTFEITGGVAVDQPMYQCEDCGITGDQYICQNCALSKHNGHDLSLAEDSYGKICHHYTKK